MGQSPQCPSWGQEWFGVARHCIDEGAITVDEHDHDEMFGRIDNKVSGAPNRATRV